ncbi:hypothetical protein QAD02_003054 [Eretmocerus hayati]|uniref:Uncharacterized protein n=1 Tax=Eretmocerus hayati TaxID=131215 RepID=A0ACC2NKU2_9HYME|nr:hypothetical protein QAD02_003054 [Eretmocerus hayati]
MANDQFARAPPQILGDVHTSYTQLVASDGQLGEAQSNYQNYARRPRIEQNEEYLVQLRETCGVLEDLYNVAYKRYNKLIRQGLRRYYDPFLLPDHRFRSKYELSEELARKLIDALRNHVGDEPNSNIPYDLRILTGLRLFATGSYQEDIADNEHQQVSKVLLVDIFMQ